MKLEQKHFDALEFVINYFRRYGTEHLNELQEIPDLLRTMQARIEYLESENDEYSRLLKLSGGVLHKAMEELAAASAPEGLSFDQIESLLPENIKQCGLGCGLVITAADLHNFARAIETATTARSGE